MTVPNNVGNTGRYSSISQPPRPSVPRFPSFDQVQNLPGFYVNVEDEIRPSDVSMDGSISFFPSRDLQKIYVRQWNKNGELERLTYIVADSSQDIQNTLNQQAIPQPVQPPQDTVIAQALNNLNSGLSATFAQFGTVLQNMSQRFDNFEQSLMTARTQPSDDGGRG